MTDVLLPEHAGFVAGMKEGRLCFPRCRDCGRFHWYPMPVCPHCQSAALAWQPVEGSAHVYSFTVVRHAFEEKWRNALPYVVALVEFADAPGVRLITNIVDIDPADVRIGLTVEPVFKGETQVVFRKATS
jgi:uncharacterized protein